MVAIDGYNQLSTDTILWSKQLLQLLLKHKHDPLPLGEPVKFSVYSTPHLGATMVLSTVGGASNMRCNQPCLNSEIETVISERDIRMLVRFSNYLVPDTNH